MRAWLLSLTALTLMASNAMAAELAAVVHKASAQLYAQPGFDAAKLVSLARQSVVKISAQQGLWYQVQLTDGTIGYVRVDEVRVEYADTEDGEANLRVLTGGKSGQGRVTETAGVRGIDASDLKSAAFDQKQMDALSGYRVDLQTAAAYAGERRWSATRVAYAGEAKPAVSAGEPLAETGSPAPAPSGALSGLLGGLDSRFGSLLGGAARLAPKREAELAAEELALGPMITGRILGARPLWGDAGAQQRVNRIGRWLASQTSRPELPWSFGVIDTPEVNAFAAPGGYVLITRGLYELLSSDGEVAAVLAHEISHCVQRDHYNVVRKQELTTQGKDAVVSRLDPGSGSMAENYARQHVEKHGATIMLTALDREAEYRADEAAQIYLARAGANPLALYAVLQKMTALGTRSAGLAQLYKTHPRLDARLDRIDRRGYGALEPFIARE